MARKAETGIEYFPMNTDIIHNPKIKLVVAEFGSKTTWAVLLPLYCKIYREKGYWMDWSDEDSKLLFAQDECKLEVTIVNELVKGCIRRSLFDKRVFDMFGVLTSDRIQENYFEATLRRKKVEIIREFVVKNESVNINRDNVYIIDLNVNIISKKVNIGTQKKKEKEIIEEEGDIAASAEIVTIKFYIEKIEKTKASIFDFIKNSKPNFIEPYVDYWNIFAKEKELAKVGTINDHRRKKFKVRIKEPEFSFTRILSKAAVSDFLITGGKWFGFDWIIENNSNYIKVLEGNYDKKEDKPDLAGNLNSIKVGGHVDLSKQ